MIRLAIAAWLIPALALAAPRPGTRLNVVTCPILRNTEVPCWLVQWDGELYFIAVQDTTASDAHPPQFNHRALVEGVVTDKPRVCGGIVLEPVHISVLHEVNRTCNAMLPAEGHPSPPHRRGVGPATARQVERPPMQPPERPGEPAEYVVRFDFELEHPWTLQTRPVEAAMRHARAAKARSVTVTGYRGYSDLADGRRLAEPDNMAEWRARTIAKALADIGVDAGSIKAVWQNAPRGGLPEDRRVVIRVEP